MKGINIVQAKRLEDTLVKRICDGNNESIRILDKATQEIAIKNRNLKLSKASTQAAKDAIVAIGERNDKYAFVFEDSVYPTTASLKVLQKGVSAFLLEEEFHHEMRRILEDARLIKGHELTAIRSYIRNCISFIDLFPDLLKLFPEHYHKMLTEASIPFYHADSSTMPAKSSSEIEKFKEENKYGLQIVRLQIIKSVILT